MLAIIIGLAVVIFGIIIGGVIGQSQNPPSVTPGDNTPDATCTQICSDLQSRHSERCMAEADEQSAVARLNSLSDQRNGFLFAAAIATAAGFAALASVVAAFTAPGFFAAAAALAVLALGLEGAVIAAENDRASKANIARTARGRENDAIRLLNEKCPNDVNACMAKLLPC